MQISFFGATDIGRKRTNNEDAFIAQEIWDNEHILLVAIDGMGGEEGGEVAAEIARLTIVEYLERIHDGSPLNLIKSAMAEANNAILHEKDTQPRYQRMGCVATAGIFDLKEQTLSIAHVGDSRLYRFSHDELTKLTHDHSLIGYQEEQGILTEEQAMHHPRRSVIERCLGAELHNPEDKHFIEAGIFPLANGETYIFCSDGLSDVLTSDQIKACLGRGRTPAAECKQLIDAANNAGGKDNITIIIAHIGRPSSGKKGASRPIPASAKKQGVNPAEKYIRTTSEASDTVEKTQNIRRNSNRFRRVSLLIVTNIISLCIGAAISFIIFHKNEVPVKPEEMKTELKTVPYPADSVSAPSDTASIQSSDTRTPNRAAKPNTDN
ncbi:MAG: protein phosphatase 2C domain-containing protein [Muribaculaceae bacterium]|nr:protein phosphatase 2C domain-containing protein [Muribaculaceae bacterium]